MEVSAYLFTCARNASLDVIKARKRQMPTSDIPEPEGERVALEVDPERSTLQEERSSAVALANARLPERHRTVLALRELEQMSYQQISEVMGMKANAVAQLLTRARLKLRDEMRMEALTRPVVGKAKTRPGSPAAAGTARIVAPPLTQVETAAVARAVAPTTTAAQPLTCRAWQSRGAVAARVAILVEAAVTAAAQRDPVTPAASPRACLRASAARSSF